MIRRRKRRLPAMQSFAEVPWLQPYPDRLLDELAPSDDQPDAVAVDRETIELAFLAAMQLLPPRQRAALIARDVLGWPAIETAELLETSVAATNSALQRARATAAVAISARGLRITMPPNPFFFQGLDEIAPLLQNALAEGDWRLVATAANRMPTAASYLRRHGDSEFRAFKFDVLRIEDGKIAEITTFGAELFPVFGLPLMLDAD
jgi:RNA polymerase sigma-70 factor (ECF subfamily)